jgi:hypothetical protein
MAAFKQAPKLIGLIYGIPAALKSVPKDLSVADTIAALLTRASPGLDNFIMSSRIKGVNIWANGRIAEGVVRIPPELARGAAGAGKLAGMAYTYWCVGGWIGACIYATNEFFDDPIGFHSAFDEVAGNYYVAGGFWAMIAGNADAERLNSELKAKLVIKKLQARAREFGIEVPRNVIARLRNY